MILIYLIGLILGAITSYLVKDKVKIFAISAAVALISLVLALFVRDFLSYIIFTINYIVMFYLLGLVVFNIIQIILNRKKISILLYFLLALQIVLITTVLMYNYRVEQILSILTQEINFLGFDLSFLNHLILTLFEGNIDFNEFMNWYLFLNVTVVVVSVAVVLCNYVYPTTKPTVVSPQQNRKEVKTESNNATPNYEKTNIRKIRYSKRLINNDDELFNHTVIYKQPIRKIRFRK